jgi:prevent-host-death family protein
MLPVHMRTLTLSEARRTLPSLADEVSTTGEVVVVTRHGKPIMKLVPCSAAERGEAELPLRGVPLRMTDDFDAPLDDWEALS